MASYTHGYLFTYIKSMAIFYAKTQEDNSNSIFSPTMSLFGI